MYETGRGVKQSDIEAARLYQIAAEQGIDFAQRNLGYLYESGRGVVKNIAEAQNLLTKAATDNSLYYDARAQFFLRQGAYEKAILDWYRYHEEHEPEKMTSSEKYSDYYQWIYDHLTQELMPRIKADNQSLIYYSDCWAIVDYTKEQTIRDGTSFIRRHGNSGAGYFALTNQGIYVCLLLSVTNKYAYKKENLLQKLLATDHDESVRIKTNTAVFHAYKNMKGYSVDKTFCSVGSNCVHLDAGHQAIIVTSIPNDCLIQAAINAAQNGMLASKEASKTSDEGYNDHPKDADFLGKLKLLKELLDAGILKESEYAEKKEKILKDIGF